MDQENLHIINHEEKQTKPSDAGEASKRPQSSLLSASFNFINSIVGSGVLGVAYAIRQSGFLVGIGLVLLVAWMTDASTMMLIKAGNLAGTSSYQGTVWRAMGKPGFYLLTFLQFTYPYLALLSYNIILGDNFTKVLIRLTGLDPQFFLVRREFIIVAGTLLVTLPLSLYKHIDRLAKVSLMSFVMVIIVCMAMIYRTFTMWDQIPVADDAWKVADRGVVQAAGVIAFMFMCHHNTFLIYSSLEAPSEERWATVSHYGVAVAAFVGLVFGINGYALFNSFSLGNLMENYCWNDDLMNVMRIIYLITILFTYPIECFVTREVIENALFSSSYTTEGDRCSYRHVLLTIIICCSVGLVSLLVSCLGPVLALNGTLFAAPLAFILPPVCYLRLSAHPIRSRANLVPLFVLTLGATLGICGIIDVFTGAAVSDSSCGHHQEMFYCRTNWSSSQPNLHHH